MNLINNKVVSSKSYRRECRIKALKERKVKKENDSFNKDYDSELKKNYNKKNFEELLKFAKEFEKKKNKK